MSSKHDQMASTACSFLLDNLRAGNSKLCQIFSTNIRRVGFGGWPEPDFVLKDYGLDATFALEFKPPFQTKREYLTGLGQATAYTKTYNYAGLIIPEESEKFLISDYIQQVARQPETLGIPLCVFKYKNEQDLMLKRDNSLTLIKEISNKRTKFTPLKSFNNEKVFWTWWRDTSPSEIYQLLDLSSQYHDRSSDIYSDFVWPEFWKIIQRGKARDWEGVTRNIKSAEKSHKQNYKIPLFGLGLIESSSGELSNFGYDLHKIGKLYGPESMYFKDALAKRLLVEGKHLELIQLFIEFQDSCEEAYLSTSSNCFKAFENFLDLRGLIPKRKPGRRTTGKKNAFIRDEPKLWNKLGFLQFHGSQYFKADKGVKFNLNKLIKLCVG